MHSFQLIPTTYAHILTKKAILAKQMMKNYLRINEQNNTSTSQQVCFFFFKDRVSINHGILKGRRKVGERK